MWATSKPLRTTTPPRSSTSSILVGRIDVGWNDCDFAHHNALLLAGVRPQVGTFRLHTSAPPPFENNITQNFAAAPTAAGSSGRADGGRDQALCLERAGLLPALVARRQRDPTGAAAQGGCLRPVGVYRRRNGPPSFSLVLPLRESPLLWAFFSRLSEHITIVIAILV